jgi:hypothetical protein
MTRVKEPCARAFEVEPDQLVLADALRVAREGAREEDVVSLEVPARGAEELHRLGDARTERDRARALSCTSRISPSSSVSPDPHAAGKEVARRVFTVAIEPSALQITA